MKFNSEFYHYQNQILDVFQKELERRDNKIHIVAPPGSGKTIIGIEIMRELFEKKEGVSLILVPNTVLQKQWKDKINKFFVEQNEKIDHLVSFNMDKISKINILTYQAISQQDRKLSIEGFSPLLSGKVLDYFKRLKEKGVSSIVLDEAHHLTAWWSKVVFEFYETLNIPYVVGLTATPPFDDVDYFSLDKNYIDLLGEVDYYIPTPAIIKSGKLAPYNDLVQFVELPENSAEMLNQKKKKLDNLIEENKQNLSDFFVIYLDNYNKKVTEDKNISGVLAFCNIYLKIKTKRFSIENFVELNFESVVYCLGLWLKKTRSYFPVGNESIRSLQSSTFQNFKTILYEIGYIWKKNKFTKFYSYLDKLEIYNPKKIDAVKNILNQEKINLGKKLRCVIITDFFEDIDGLLDCKNILKNMGDFSELNPTLLSGQGIFNLNGEILKTNILEITRDFNNGKIKLLIGTRGILGEGWDSPKVNTLIDLTGISSFMSVNQVRGRAIRQDLENPKKVANIYDIVTIGTNNILHKDFDRLKKKHNQVYGVDDSGLVVKGIGHISNSWSTEGFRPLNSNKKLKHSVENISEFNKTMLIRSTKRDYFYKLWGVGNEFKNKEQFILQLNINPMFKYFPKKSGIFSGIYRFIFKYKNVSLENIGKKTYYDKILKNYIDNFLYASKKILIKKGVLSNNFSYKIIIEGAGKFKIIGGKNAGEFEIKKFIEIISEIFSPVTNQKYLFNEPLFELNQNIYNLKKYNFPLPSQISGNTETRILYNKYFNKKLFANKNIDYKFEYITNNRKKYLGYSVFIKSEIEKIWI